MRPDSHPSSLVVRTLALLFVVAATSSPASAQGNGNGNNGNNGNGGGGGGGGTIGLLSPVVLGWPNGCGSTAWTLEPEPGWASELPSEEFYYHPEQLTPAGQERALVPCVSRRGDLTHGGGARYVVDVRIDAGGGQALIATLPESASEENPSWYYDGSGGADDGHDHVLSTDAQFLVDAARWSRDGTRLALEATEVATGNFGIFVADVVFDGSGHPTGLVGATLVAGAGRQPSWGGDRIGFHRGVDLWGGDGYFVDVSAPSAPIEVALGPVAGWVSLDGDGSHAVFARDTGARRDLFVVDLASLATTQVTDASRVTEESANFPSWSTDDATLLFSVQRERPGCHGLATISPYGSDNRRLISQPFVERVGKGRNSSSYVVGGLERAIWRD